MPLDALAERLTELQRMGGIQASRITPAMRTRTQILFQLGILKEQRRGAGKHVTVTDPTAFNNWIQRHYPSGLHGITQQHNPRAEAVANYRNSKQRSTLNTKPILMRGFHQTTLTRHNQTFPLAELTQQYGIAAITIQPTKNPWTLTGNLTTVENQEAFLNIETINPNTQAALWTAGRLNEQILTWITHQPNLTVTHVGDYDPVGLDEYHRLRKHLNQRAKLHIPHDLRTRIQQYGNPKLLQRSVGLFARVKAEADEQSSIVVRLLEEFGCGLEQEALLLRIDEPPTINNNG